MIWQISCATGWSVNYVLWRVNYPTLLMMMADAPRYIKVKDDVQKPNGHRKRTSEEILEFFQTKLKK
jgi:hypothetical protein